LAGDRHADEVVATDARRGEARDERVVLDDAAARRGVRRREGGEAVVARCGAVVNGEVFGFGVDGAKAAADDGEVLPAGGERRDGAGACGVGRGGEETTGDERRLLRVAWRARRARAVLARLGQKRVAIATARAHLRRG